LEIKEDKMRPTKTHTLTLRRTVEEKYDPNHIRLVWCRKWKMYIRRTGCEWRIAVRMAGCKPNCPFMKDVSVKRSIRKFKKLRSRRVR
jgi:hypothetical protein